MSDVPANVQEFSKIAGLIFAQLFKAFPVSEDIDRNAICEAMGVPPDNYSKLLPSGRSFADVQAHTISWLNTEGFIRAAGMHPAERVSLTQKGLETMNMVPEGRKEPIGSELTRAIEQRSSSRLDIGFIGDLIGSVIGGFVKSLSSG